MSRPWFLGACLAWCGACADVATAPPVALTYAYAAPACAPWDGYAVSLVLRTDSLPDSVRAIENGSSPMLRIALYPREAGGLAVRTYAWPAAPEEASGSWCRTGACAAVPRGRVTIRHVGPDHGFDGELTVWLADGSRMNREFRAAWRPREQLCG